MSNFLESAWLQKHTRATGYTVNSSVNISNANNVKLSVSYNSNVNNVSYLHSDRVKLLLKILVLRYFYPW